MPRLASDAIGLSYRIETEDLFGAPGLPAPVLVCEVHAEDRRLGEREFERLRDLARAGCEVYLHSTTLNALSDLFLEDGGRIETIARLAEAVGARLVSGHLASGEGYVGPIRAFDRPAYSARLVDQVLQRMSTARSRLGVGVAFENIAYYGPRLNDEITEIEFLNEITAANGAEIVFDVSNHLANLTNGSCVGGDLYQLAMERVKYVHISGGKWLQTTYVDTHGDPIPPFHIEALARLRRESGPLHVLYERDIRFERRSEIESDLIRVWNALQCGADPADRIA